MAAEADAVSVPPANAGRAKTDAAETDPSLKTPATAKAASAANAKVEGDNKDTGIVEKAPAKAAAAAKPSLDDERTVRQALQDLRRRMT